MYWKYIGWCVIFNANLIIYSQFSLASLDDFWDNTSKHVSKTSCPPITMHYLLIIFFPFTFMQLFFMQQRRIEWKFVMFDIRLRPRYKWYLWTAWPLKMGAKCCVETFVQKYHSTVHKIPPQKRASRDWSRWIRKHFTSSKPQTTYHASTGRLYSPRKYSWYSFLLEAESTPGPSAVGRFLSMKNSIDPVRSRTCDLPTCSAVSQQTAPPRPVVTYQP